jgi:hypothetical protein
LLHYFFYSEFSIVASVPGRNCYCKVEKVGSGQIPADMIQGGSEGLRSDIYKLINYIWNEE